MAQNTSTESDDQPTQPRSSANDFSDESDSDGSILHDSIAQRRRRAIYFQRPPVWYPRSCTHADSSTTSRSSGIQCSRPQNDPSSSHRQEPWFTSATGDVVLDLLLLRRRLQDLEPGNDPGPYLLSVGTGMPSDMSLDSTDAGTDSTTVENQNEISLVSIDFLFFMTCLTQQAKDTDVQSSRGTDEQEELAFTDAQEELREDGSHTQSSEQPYSQSEAKLCTRLRLYRDIRLGRSEHWAIQEGSIVIGIDPSYTQRQGGIQHFDEFIPENGDVYVVCRIYADLWALCLRVSIQPMASSAMNLAFLPLCAVTLAANFSAFLNRCNEYPNLPDECLYPGNGQPVVPPPRSHSFLASTHVLHRERCFIQLPPMAYQAYNNFSFLENPGVEFVPLDSTLEELFSGVGTKGKRMPQIRKNMSLRNLLVWNTRKLPDSIAAGDCSNTNGSRSHRTSATVPSIQNISSSRPIALQDRKIRRERQNSSSGSVGVGLRRLFGMSEE